MTDHPQPTLHPGAPSAPFVQSVEFGHLYADERVGPEQRETAKVAATYPGIGLVLVDDYNAPAPWDPEYIHIQMMIQGKTPDGIFSESDLVPAAEQVINQVGGREGKRQRRYWKTHGKLSCSMLTATWYLLRLGVLTSTARCKLTGITIPVTERLVNVLPLAYEPVEREVDEILLQMPHPIPMLISKIERRWTDVHNREAWERFKPNAYYEHNYAHVHPADLAIARRLTDVWAEIGGVYRAIEIGAGANLYPILAALPHVTHLDVTDYSGRNVDWLKQELTHFDPRWLRFHPELGMTVEGVAHLLSRRVRVRHGDVYALVPGRYDVASMHFVAESITADLGEFQRICGLVMDTVTLGGYLLASFMLGSEGYTVAGVKFPAVSIGLDDIAKAFGKHDIRHLTTIDQGEEWLRPGYEGMAFAWVQKEKA